MFQYLLISLNTEKGQHCFLGRCYGNLTGSEGPSCRWRGHEPNSISLFLCSYLKSLFISKWTSLHICDHRVKLLLNFMCSSSCSNILKIGWKHLQLRKKLEKTYPHKFHVSMSVLEYAEKYGGLNCGDHLKDIEVSLAGIQNHKTQYMWSLI